MDEYLEIPEAEVPTDFQEVDPEPEGSVVSDEDNPQYFCDTREGKLLKQLIEDLERPEQNIRETMVRIWKKMENYWRDRQYIIWDDFASDWRTPDEIKATDNTLDIDPSAYAKIVNIYKAHGQAIISALSAGLPHVKFFPDDADVQEDVFTAKSYSKLAELVQKRNKGQLLFIKSLFVIYNFGTLFAYNDVKDTTEFGTIKRAQYVDTPITVRQQFCPACGMLLGSDQYDMPEATDEVPENPESVQSTNGIPEPEPVQCPNCGNVVQPDHEDYDDIIPRLTGYTEEPKTHECIEIFGPLHVKVPHWASTQAGIPYLTLETEEHIALLKEIYHEVADKLSPGGDDTTYERLGRRNSDYRGDTPQDLATLSRSWIRPWAFNMLPSEDAQYLKELYPNGCYFARVNDLPVEAVPDKLDDHWTIAIDPLSNHIHSDPMAQPLIPVQDITNELTNLTLETVEFGIPETFYEAETIDRDEYQKSEARPGMLYPAKARATMGLDSNFHTIKTAALSQEVDNFADRMTQAGQFVSGAFPTIWGGALEGGGGTAKEYEQSRAMALQRLNLTWLMVKSWWAEVIGKSVRELALNMKDDEKFVEEKGSSFVNVWIRRAEMTGKVGQVEPDINEAFPVSWAQKRDILMSLINMKNPLVEQVIAHPENAGTVAGTIGFPELYIPGDESRDKQLWEISQLVQSEPTPTGMPDPTKPGQEVFQPTIPVEEWEDHAVEAETCKAWLNSPVGIDCRQANPAGFMNVVSHWRLHEFKVQQAAMAQAQAEAESGQGSGQGEEEQNNDEPSNS